MIETKRLLIQNWTETMAADFFELSQDAGFTMYPITDYRQASVESSRQWIRQNVGKYAAIEKSSHKLIGMGGLTPWNLDGESLIDLTYRLRSSAQGQGYGKELALALIDYGFQKLDLDQITATITPDNLPSKILAERLGMKFDHRIQLLGVPTDLYRLFRTP